MKILLAAINAKYIHSNLAVYSLRAYAKEFREQIALGEYTINHNADDILEQIYLEKPDVLCFSCYIWNIRYVKEIFREFHKLKPDVPIWLGGPEVSYETDRFMEENPEVTGIMVAEGERIFSNLCRHYVNHDLELEEIRGIVYRTSDISQPGTGQAGVSHICHTPPEEPLDMSTIPFPYEDLADFKNRIIYYESSRGCPFSCSYCLSSIDKKLRFRDLELVKKELLFFLEKEVPQVKFVDRTFNCSHGHAMAIWEFLKDHDNGITNFHFEVSADLLNEEETALIEAMRPGLIQLEIGVQSTNEATIREIHRTMNLKKLKKTVKKIQEGGNVHEHLDLIAGLPYEDYESFAASFDEVYALKPEQLQLGFLKVLKGSYMYEHAAEYDVVYHEEPPYEVMSTRWLSYEEILKIRRVEEMVEAYYNSGQFEVTVKLMELAFPSAFFMFGELGGYYADHGFFKMSHSRIRRCEILLDFLAEHDKEHMPLYREALTFDLYYRENSKSRPGFAADQTEWKELSRKYCRTGKTKHLEGFHYLFPSYKEKTLQEYPSYQEKRRYVLFDYENRDALNHQANVIWLSDEKTEIKQTGDEYE